MEQKTKEQILETYLGEEVSKHLWNNLKSAYTGSLSAMTEWERQQNQVLREENERLREGLRELMEGVAGLPPLTAIAGVLEKQYTKAKHLLTI